MSRLNLLAAAALLAVSAPVFATAFATDASAEESCHVSGAIMTRDAVTKSLQDRGYTQIRSLSTHNGCYEAKGIDSKGKRFELEVNGSTGEIVNVE
jgi:hypothetical protein